MITSVDNQYRHLSALAIRHGKTLNELGRRHSSQHNNYLSLGDCCWYVLEKTKWGSPDPYNYLATFDEYSRILDESQSNKLWRKLINGSRSTFLDTLAEAAWGIHFKRKGYSVLLEAPLDSSVASSKDADFLVTIDGQKWWFDVLSIGVDKPRPANNQDLPVSIGRKGVTAIASGLAKKARKKYSDKFKDAVRSGILNDSRIGVLICILKVASSMVSLFMHVDAGDEVAIPTGLFDSAHPGLDLVWVHSLRSCPDSVILEPASLCKWVRCDQHAP